MLHPLFKTLATEPALVMEHASAYLHLAGLEARDAARHFKRRALVGVAVALGLLLGLTLAGAALLVLAAKPWASLATPWLLVATPALPLLAALAGALWLAHTARPEPFTLLREQWALDRHLLDQPKEPA
jgi:uncharacterized membrane protein YqjE